METSDDTSSSFEEGASALPEDSGWTAILVDKPLSLFLSESSTNVNNTKPVASVSCYNR